jgi:hypothetical protein
MACAADEGCSCVFECFEEQPNPSQCLNLCGLMPNQNAAINELRGCSLANCGDVC